VEIFRFIKKPELLCRTYARSRVAVAAAAAAAVVVESKASFSEPPKRPVRIGIFCLVFWNKLTI